MNNCFILLSSIFTLLARGNLVSRFNGFPLPKNTNFLNTPLECMGNEDNIELCIQDDPDVRSNCQSSSSYAAVSCPG